MGKEIRYIDWYDWLEFGDYNYQDLFRTDISLSCRTEFYAYCISLEYSNISQCYIKYSIDTGGV